MLDEFQYYRKAAAEECGKTFMGLMSDEPAFTGTPWTPAMLDEFQKRKGYDVRPYLAWISGGGTVPEDARRAKADYWDVWSDLFGENYFSRLSAWCRANNLEYICHLDKDDSNPMFVRTGGDYFKDMPMPAPTIDAVKSDPPRPSVVVTPSSVAPIKPPITTMLSLARGGITRARRA